MERFLKAREACELLGISLSLLYKLTASGGIPCMRIGRSLYFMPDELVRWSGKVLTGHQVELI